jgi:LPXTG-motif cell wall-anchored protein
MRKFAIAALAVSAAWLTVLGLSSSAQAYPDVQINLTVNKPVVYSGDTFTATAAANVQCDWSVSESDSVQPGSGTTMVATYVAPKVDKITKIPLTGVCSYSDPSAAVRSSAAATYQRTTTVTVLPRAAATTPATNGANLPKTGGPSPVFLAGGLGLLLIGGLAVFFARRRAEEAELSWQIS